MRLIKVIKKKYWCYEFLASKCGIKDNSEVMLIRNKNLSVVPITTHIDLKKVAKKIKAKLYLKVRTLNTWFFKTMEENQKSQF